MEECVITAEQQIMAGLKTVSGWNYHTIMCHVLKFIIMYNSTALILSVQQQSHSLSHFSNREVPRGDLSYELHFIDGNFKIQQN